MKKNYVTGMLWCGLVVLLLFLCNIATIRVSAAEEPYTYELDEDGNATITGYEGNESILTIPGTLDGHNVVKIGNDAFRRDANLTKISMPDSITEIGSGVFAECSGLREVKLSESLQTLAAFAFYDCDQLSEIKIPKSLNETKNAYYYEYHYGYIHGPFYGCDGLKTIIFEEGTTKVANGLFGNCPGIENVIIPDTVTVIGDYAFGDCVNLQSVKIGSGVTKIENNAFIRTVKLTGIMIPDSVTEIGSGVFAECEELSQVKLSKSLKTIAAHAFYNCDKITEIEIPKSLEETKNAYYSSYYGDYIHGPFYGCDGLKTITFEQGTTKIANGLFGNCTGIENVTIPDTVTVIEDYSFGDCVNLQSVKIGSGVTKIENNAFRRDKRLTGITIPDSVTEIGSGVFAECEELSQVKLSRSLKAIAAHAFYNCDKIIEIEIPKSLDGTKNAYYPSYHGDYVYGPFYECDGLKTVTFEEGTTKIANGLFAYCPGLETITIPDTVEKIENNAFLACSQLKKVEMTDSVKSFGNALFYKDSALTDIRLPNQLPEIPNETFRGCSSLEALEIPTAVSRIGANAFRESGVKKVEISSDVTDIGNEAFKESGVEELVIKNAAVQIPNDAFRNCTALRSVDLGKKIISIGRYAFENCDLLTDITIPDSAAEIGESVFANSELLKNVTLGTGLTKIPNRAFFECPSLETIILPYRIAEIQSEAFSNCTELKELTIPRETTTIADTILSYPAKMTIYGVAGTTAETYANSKNITFVGREIHAEQVAFDQTELILHNGKSGNLILSITPFNFTDKVTWKSSDTDVVTVSDTGVVKAQRGGSATIKVNVGELSASCTVTVVQPVTSIYLSESSLELEAFETETLTADVFPDSAANKNLTWSSSNEKIATVDQNGLVTAVAKGTAVITVKAEDGSNETDTCNVTVLNNGYIAKSVSELESEHNYSDNCSDFWLFTSPGSKSLNISFHEKTNLEDGFDFLSIYTGNGMQVGEYTGTELAGRTITVTGDTVKIKLVSDDGGNAWGFKVDKITDSLDNPVKLRQKIAGTNAYVKTVGDPGFRLDANIVTGDGTLSYVSDNENVAVVSKDGMVTIKAAGTAVITAMASETENYEAENLKIKIQVNKKNAQEQPSGSQGDNKPKPVKVSGIKISSSLSNKIAAGKKVKLIADVSPANAAVKSVQWTSSNKKIATVNSSGIVTMKKNSGGKSVVITATATDGGGAQASYKITSMKGVVKKISISGKKEVKAGKTLKLKAKVTAKQKANKKLQWKSSNTKYAKVNGSGTVKALKAGKGKKVKITAMATDGSGKKKSVTIKIK